MRSVALHGGRAAPVCERGISEDNDRARRPAPPGRPIFRAGTVARVMAENPTASIRQAAGAAGVAPSTVQRLAAGLARPDKPAPNGVTIDVRNSVLRPAEAPVADPAFRSSPEGSEAVVWLARTAVSVEDLHAHLGSLHSSATS